MIKAIIFDCFGVLTTDGWLPFKSKHFGDRAELRQQATDLNRQVDAGLLDYDEFISGVAKLADVPIADAKRKIENNVPNAPLFRLIKELKPTYKIGFLSNAGANWVSDLFSPEQVKLFDVVAVSSETGFVKPDERAYRDIAAKLEIAPAEGLFVDDQPRYCEAAEKTGMKAICYKDFEQFKRQLTSSLKVD